MKKVGFALAALGALILAVSPAMQARAAAPKQQKTLLQGLTEEIGNIGKPAPAKKAAKKKAAKKDAKKDDKKKK
jgi:anti-sigma factor RsiW